MTLIHHIHIARGRVQRTSRIVDRALSRPRAVAPGSTPGERARRGGSTRFHFHCFFYIFISPTAVELPQVLAGGAEPLDTIVPTIDDVHIPRGRFGDRVRGVVDSHPRRPRK